MVVRCVLYAEPRAVRAAPRPRRASLGEAEAQTEGERLPRAATEGRGRGRVRTDRGTRGGHLERGAAREGTSERAAARGADA